MNLKRISSLIAGPGGALLLLFFFLPWVSVSCLGNDIITVSGYDFANGADEDNVNFDFSSFGMEENLFGEMPPDAEFEISPEDFVFSETEMETEDSFLEANALFWLIPIFALMIVAFAGISYFETKIANLWTGMLVYMLPALVVFGLMLAKYIEISGDIDDAETQAAADGMAGAIQASYEIGWWLTGLTLLAIFGAGVMLFLSTEESPAIASAAPPQPPPVPLTAEQMKSRFAEAKQLIQAKDYDAARRILRTIQHPTADAWLAKLDEIDPFGDIPD